MLIKSMARKSISFGQLLRYVDAPGERGAVILHNLGSSDPDAIRQEFQRNAHLLPPRKNGNVLYHEILSFGAKDRERVTPAILEDLTRRYLELRAPYALGYARSHLDTDAPHVHVVLSANDVGSSKRLRLSRPRFAAIKRDIERQQLEDYPELRHSQAQHLGKKLKRGKSESGGRNQAIRGIVLDAVMNAFSGEDCYRLLREQGLTLYKRGPSVGVEDGASGRRVRLKTLALEEEFDHAFKSWQRVAEIEAHEKDAISREHRRSRPDPPELDR